MSEKNKVITFRPPVYLRGWLEKEAELQHRSLSSQIVSILDKEYRESTKKSRD